MNGHPVGFAHTGHGSLDHRSRGNTNLVARLRMRTYLDVEAGPDDGGEAVLSQLTANVERGSHGALTDLEWNGAKIYRWGS